MNLESFPQQQPSPMPDNERDQGFERKKRRMFVLLFFVSTSTSTSSLFFLTMRLIWLRVPVTGHVIITTASKISRDH